MKVCELIKSGHTHTFSLCSVLTNQSKHAVFQPIGSKSVVTYARFPALGIGCMFFALTSDWFESLAAFVVIGQSYENCSM